VVVVAVVVLVMLVCKPILVFSFGFDKAEQHANISCRITMMFILVSLSHKPS
jgi:hypothetical protein